MRRCSASLVVSVLALVLALAGTAVAGGYIITSTKQIKPSVRKALKGKRGPRGYAGIDGAQGAPGVPGQFSAANVTVVRGAPVTMCSDSGSFQSCQVASSVAQCPAGSIVLGGGWDGLSNPPVDATVGYNYALAAGAWEVVMSNAAAISASFQAVATCATGGAVTRSSRSGLADRAARDRARMIAALIK